MGEHGWLVQKRWILGEPVEDKGLLEAPELGPVADMITMYEALIPAKRCACQLHYAWQRALQLHIDHDDPA